MNTYLLAAFVVFFSWYTTTSHAQCSSCPKKALSKEMKTKKTSPLQEGKNQFPEQTEIPHLDNDHMMSNTGRQKETTQKTKTEINTVKELSTDHSTDHSITNHSTDEHSEEQGSDAAKKTFDHWFW